MTSGTSGKSVTMTESLSPEKMNRFQAMVLRAVESLLDEGISKETMEESCELLDVTSFWEVAEERAVAKLCGYPLCSSGLQEKKWSQYRIVRNKVYDTTERRRFCSDLCYERFVHVRNQLPEEPLWFRGPRPASELFRLSLLENESGTRRGLPGREVELVMPDDLTDEMNQLTLGGEPKKPEVAGQKIAKKTPQQVGQKVDSRSTTQKDNAQTTKLGLTTGDFAEASLTGTAMCLTELLCDDTDEDYDQTDHDEEDDDFPIARHGDGEDSALGNWRPSHGKSKGDATQKKPRSGPILIDAPPMPPKTKNVGDGQKRKD